MQRKDNKDLKKSYFTNLISYIQTLAVDWEEQHIMREEDHQLLLVSLQEQLF